MAFQVALEQHHRMLGHLRAEMPPRDHEALEFFFFHRNLYTKKHKKETHKNFTYYTNHKNLNCQEHDKEASDSAQADSHNKKTRSIQIANCEGVLPALAAALAAAPATALAALSRMLCLFLFFGAIISKCSKTT
jgi:hypothetical protein